MLGVVGNSWRRCKRKLLLQRILTVLGVGCRLRSQSRCLNLALGEPPLAAVKAAKTDVTQALKYALDMGQG